MDRWTFVHADFGGGDGLAQALRNLPGFFAPAFRQQNGELLTPQAADRVLRAQRRLACLHQALQDPISDRVSVVVVDQLEMVQIQHQDGQVLGIALRARQLVIGQFQKSLSTTMAVRGSVFRSAAVAGRMRSTMSSQMRLLM